MKTLEWYESKGYINSPKISFVIVNHNLSAGAIRAAKTVRPIPDSEIIAIDDGSEHDDTMAVVNELHGANEFVLHCNDLFDVIVFNRAFELARGEYICVLQDDDLYDVQRLMEALKILDSDPKMAILGGRDAVQITPKDKKVKVYRPDRWCYAPAVNAAPIWVRRSAFLELGGFDRDFAPCLWHEPEFCFRAWTSKRTVGWYPSGAEQGKIPTWDRRKSKESLKNSATAKNFALLIKRYGRSLSRINKAVDKANGVQDG